MDDCNAIRAGTRIRELICSDSSMDDCNDIPVKKYLREGGVQIPLWTIVTINSSNKET